MLLASVLDKLMKTGRLRVEDHGGGVHNFGDGTGPQVTLRFNTASIALRVMFNPGLAFPEGYLRGEIDVLDGTIYDFLLMLHTNNNQGRGLKAYGRHKRLQKIWRRLVQFNLAAVSGRNARHHYDISEDLYRLFLDSDMQYSCGYFDHEEDSLEDAQLAKKRHIAAKLNLKPGMKVLDIGCGWGGLGLYLAEVCGAEVVGVTLSPEQHRVAAARAAESPAAGRISFRVQDYRHIEDSFDRVVSVGMFEHVGVPFYRTFFDVVRDRLTADGVALIHTIARAHGPSATNAYIQKYIFPGAYTPAVSEVVPAIEKSGMFLTDVEILRLHYGLTARHWRHRFAKNRAQALAIYDEQFCRMWEFYIATSELEFTHSGFVVAQFQMSKAKHTLPQTRDYIGAWEAEHRDAPLPRPS